MKTSKISSNFKKALFPAIMIIISFVLFVAVYWLSTVRAIEPSYFESLIFAIPFVCFGITTFFTAKGKLKIVALSLITICLIFVLGFTAFYIFMEVGSLCT